MTRNKWAAARKRDKERRELRKRQRAQRKAASAKFRKIMRELRAGALRRGVLPSNACPTLWIDHFSSHENAATAARAMTKASRGNFISIPVGCRCGGWHIATTPGRVLNSGEEQSL